MTKMGFPKKLFSHPRRGWDPPPPPLRVGVEE